MTAQISAATAVVPQLALHDVGNGSGGGTGAFATAAGTTFVRVGVPAAAIAADPVLSGTGYSAGYGAGAGTGYAASGAASRGATAGVLGGVLGWHEDGVIDPGNTVSFRRAVHDLPPAATKAVRVLLDNHRTLTVSDIHQRRPPYMDQGPPPDAGGKAERELHPADFARSLRRHASDAAGQKRSSFLLGAPATWQRKTETLGELDTFDFMAKHRGVRYYLSDFSKPRSPRLRGGTLPTTREAVNVPTMLHREEYAQRTARAEQHLLDRIVCPPDGDDSAIAYGHRDQYLGDKRATTPRPGGHIVRYPNLPPLAASMPLSGAAGSVGGGEEGQGGYGGTMASMFHADTVRGAGEDQFGYGGHLQ